MQPLPPAAPADLAEKHRFFRALHGANPAVRRALLLLSQGWSLEQAAEAVGCHPRLLRRRLEALGRATSE
ncbi:MAG TPA: helix-turn-helix domain-containing protein [Polyangiaceae bacterium]